MRCPQGRRKADVKRRVPRLGYPRPRDAAPFLDSRSCSRRPARRPRTRRARRSSRGSPTTGRSSSRRTAPSSCTCSPRRGRATRTVSSSSRPVLARGTVLGGREKVTQIEQDVSGQATVAGINGDLFSAGDGHPAGIFMSGGVLAHPPFGSRSSIGVDSTGGLHVDRVKFFGTWQGTGQRRPLNGLNQVPAQGQVVLLTPAFGPKAPALPGSAEIVLQSFPAADAERRPLRRRHRGRRRTAASRSRPAGRSSRRPARSPPSSRPRRRSARQIAARLILQPAWTNVVAALGGGPVLVRNSAPVFRSLEDFTNDQIAARSPRAGVGQLADGRIVLVAVDGDQPGYSVGLTSFELAQTMARLGAVTAAAVESGPDVTRRVRRAAAEPAERRRRRARRQGGAARRVLRRLRAAAAAAAPDRRGRARRRSSCRTRSSGRRR